jgi:hypothetical protein
MSLQTVSPSHSSQQNNQGNAVSSSSSFGKVMLKQNFNILTSIASGYLAGLTFSIINPIGGAIFGATGAFTNITLWYLVSKLDISSTTAKTILYGLSFIASMAIAGAVTTAVGFPITFVGAISLTFAMLVTYIAVSMVAVGIICCNGCFLGAILGVTVSDWKAAIRDNLGISV